METIRSVHVLSKSEFPDWKISDNLYKYDPREVMAKLFHINWTCFQYTYTHDKLHGTWKLLKEAFPQTYPEVSKVIDQQDKICVPWSKGCVTRATTTYLTTLAKKEKVNEYASYKTIQFEKDILYLLFTEQSNLTDQQLKLADSAIEVAEKILVFSLISHVHNTKEDELFYLIYGTHALKRLSKFDSDTFNSQDSLNKFLLENTSCKDLQEFFNHFLPFTFQARRQPTPYSKTDLSSNIKMGLSFEEIIQRAKDGRIVKGIGLLQSMPVVDAEAVSEELRGQVISDFESLFKYMSIGLIDSVYWTELNPAGIRPEAYGDYKGKTLETFVELCFDNLRKKSAPKRHTAFLDELKVTTRIGDIEYADMFIAEGKRCIIGQVKQIGWTQKQEYATTVDTLLKNTSNSDFATKIGLHQLKESLERAELIYDHLEIKRSAKTLEIIPVLITTGKWLVNPFMYQYIQELWKDICPEESSLEVHGRSISLRTLSIHSAEELLWKSSNMTFKNTFTPDNPRIGNPAPIFKIPESTIQQIQAQLLKGYKEIIEVKES